MASGEPFRRGWFRTGAIAEQRKSRRTRHEARSTRSDGDRFGLFTDAFGLSTAPSSANRSAVMKQAVKEIKMPTYVCSLAEGFVNDGQKAAIAEAVTRIHSEETGAPSYFVQVVIEEKKPADRFLGGSRASGQIWIRGDIRAGRTQAQRNAMMSRIMQEVARITNAREEEVWIYLCNLAPTDMLEYGHVLPQPGDEAAWFDRLPKLLQDYLGQLGTTKDTFTL
jgi:phenylpyruvate tautomerase PptA (4-oxalocrotonate tautomerase family)